MTRASDRTLLQALGFNDPDKGNEEHDLGCRYLIQPAQMEKLVEMLFPRDKLKSPWWDYKSAGCQYGSGPHEKDELVKHTDISVMSVHHKGSLECVVQRSGGYHIGFLDAFITPVWTLCATQRSWRRPNIDEIERQVGKRPIEQEGASTEARWAWEKLAKEALNQWVEYESRTVIAEAGARLDRLSEAKTGCVGIEVKIGKVPIGNAIRQIKLYASYCPDVAHWVLATRYSISKDDHAALKNEKITHIRLAAGFDAYLESQRNAPEAESPEL